MGVEDEGRRPLGWGPFEKGGQKSLFPPIVNFEGRPASNIAVP